MAGAAQAALLAKSNVSLALSVGISGPPYTSGAGSPLTSSATASGSGGTPPYTYSWAKQSGAANVVINGGSTSAVCGFTSGTIGSGQIRSAIFRCTVTDAVLATAFSDCQADFERF